jgi:DNA-binding NarL/FixJ family response regulator
MNNHRELKILLVEDDELFRLGLTMGLARESSINIVGEASDDETALELVKSLPLDLVLLDLGLPGVISGIELCQKIKAEYPKLPILVLTSHTETSLINQLIAVGTQGYCHKGVPAETLILAIKYVVSGASWWDENCTAQIRSVFGNQSLNLSQNEHNINPLTTREQEILSLIVQGKSHQEIGEILYISVGTVRVHVHAILQKLEVRYRTQAAILAIQHKLVSMK